MLVLARKLKSIRLGFALCAAAFIAAIWGSYYCGHELMQPGISEPRAKQLWNLIYFHFALSQLSVLIAALLFYLVLMRSKRCYLIVSYAPSAVGIEPPGIDLPAGRSYYSSLSTLQRAKLPPVGCPTLVFPMMMQSGYTSSERLEACILDAYRSQGKIARHGESGLQLIMQPVLGASPWLAQLVATHLRRSMREGDALLLVAHNTAASQSPAPEPELFCQRLRKIFPRNAIHLARFGEDGHVEDRLSEIHALRVHLIPFLMSEGYHTQHDLPTEQQAHALGKQLIRHPVIGELMRGQQLD